ncbi:MAG: hypothetical protein Q8L48_08905 [Archangium sp.]|nr:hypothetical protein [Archangium sp.]
MQLHCQGNPSGTNAEIVIQGAGAQLRVQTGGRSGFRPCTPTRGLPDAGWHLFELLTTGNGTLQGTARGFIDGEEFCSSTNDWTGYPAFQAFTGTGAYDQGWVGALVVDEFRVAAGVPVDRLEVTAGVLTGTEGDCLALTVDTGGIDDAGVLDRTILVNWLQSPGGDGGLVALSNVGCTEWDGGVADLSFPLSARTDYGVKLVRAGSFEVSVESPGLLGGALLRFDVLEADAGLADAGVADAGVDVNDAGAETDAGPTPGSLHLAVGCACSSAPVNGAWWLLVFAVTARRRSRRCSTAQEAKQFSH